VSDGSSQQVPGGPGLDGRTAIITGGGRGLGAAMARAFAGSGADVVIASRKLEACEALAAEIEHDFGVRALPVACHVGRWDDVGALVDRAYDEFGRIDVLVNNAGMSPRYDSLHTVSEQLWDAVIGVNLKGPFRLSVLVGQRMAEGAGGSIINISSVGSRAPEPHAVPYGAAKAGLNNLTLGLARSFGPKVRVNAIVAGAFLTDVARHWDLDEVEGRARERFALQRIGRPEEIVGTALYLASDASSYTTGALIAVDGGWS
jgi:NAD(P)-dependent dehydrogenase (short-subunit alcohol dehydrogenase family)